MALTGRHWLLIVFIGWLLGFQKGFIATVSLAKKEKRWHTSCWLETLRTAWGLGEIKTGPPNTEGKERPKEEADVSRWVDGGGNKQGNLQDPPWTLQGKWISPPACQKLTSLYYTQPAIGVNSISSRWSQQHFALSRLHHWGRFLWAECTLLSQGCILEADSSCQNSVWNIHCKDRGGGDEPPIAHRQLRGQLKVMSPRWLSPTEAKMWPAPCHAGATRWFDIFYSLVLKRERKLQGKWSGSKFWFPQTTSSRWDDFLWYPNMFCK